MLKPTIAIFGSYLFGLVFFAFMFGYFSLMEGVKSTIGHCEAERKIKEVEFAPGLI